MIQETTTYTTSDGKTWTDKAAAERHEEMLERIAIFCEERGARTDRAVARVRNIVLAWETKGPPGVLPQHGEGLG